MCSIEKMIRKNPETTALCNTLCELESDNIQIKHWASHTELT